MAVCAYCKRSGTMTREHIIPSFLCVFQKELSPSILGWNERAEKMISGEAKIRDVCDVCNNGVLSELDSYGKEVLVASKILVRNYTKLNLTLRYEYDRLVRWLLKLSFNSSRVDQAHSYLFEPFIPFILGEAASPVRSKIAVLAYLAEPVILSDEQSHRAPYIDITAGSVRLNPFLVRICYGAVSGAKGYVLRLNVFGPLVFFALMFNGGVLPGHAASAIRHFCKALPGAVELSPKLKLAELRTGRRTWLDLYQQQAVRQMDSIIAS